MNNSILVVDGFYADAMDVRELALKSDFSVRGTYPGLRTEPFLHDGIRDAIQALVRQQITFWPETEYNGAFQYTLSGQKTWVHSDHTTNRAGVLYLTPDAPLGAGTGFYRHRETGAFSFDPGSKAVERLVDDYANYDRWERTDYVANVFNRIVLFDANRFHAGEGYFGTNLDNGRLFQTFFFSVN